VIAKSVSILRLAQKSDAHLAAAEAAAEAAAAVVAEVEVGVVVAFARNGEILRRENKTADRSVAVVAEVEA
jgi:3',5'-cyclic AMP phosphodiesterase CpdA